MTPVAFQTVSTASSYEAALVHIDYVHQSSHSVYATSPSKGELFRIDLDYRSRGLRFARTATTSIVPSEHELRATFAALGFDYDPDYDFSNASAAARARAALSVEEELDADIDLPPA